VAGVNALLGRLQRRRAGEAGRQDDGAAELLGDRLAERGLRPLGDVQVGQAERDEPVDERGVGRLDLGLGHVVERAAGRDADPDAVGADRLGDRRGDLDDEAGAGLRRAAVAVGALVGAVGQELVQQVAVRAVQLDPVQTGLDGAAGGVDELRDDPRQLVGGQLARHLEGLHALRGEHLAGRRDRRRRDGALAGDRGVADATGVHELHEDPAVLLVDRVGDQAPAGDLGVGVQAGGVRVALADGRRLGALGDDEAGAGALGVVLGVDRGRGGALAGAVAGHRRHDEAVLQLKLAQLVGRKKVDAHGGSLSRLHLQRLSRRCGARCFPLRHSPP